MRVLSRLELFLGLEACATPRSLIEVTQLLRDEHTGGPGFHVGARMPLNPFDSSCV